MNVSGGDLGARVRRLNELTELARTRSVPMSPLQRMEGLQLLNTRLGRQRRRWMALIGLPILGAAAAVAGAVILLRSGPHISGHNGAIAYQIEGGEIGDGGYIRSHDTAGSLLRFEEGTELRLMSGARGRLSSVDGRGARFAIEEGEAEVKVTPRPGARWLVDAGPFLITVRGTVFTASWDGVTERLDIHMKKGLVSVTGPLADGVMAVRAGQHLSVNVKKREVLLRQIEDGEDGVAAPAPTLGPPPVQQRYRGTGGSERGSSAARGSRASAPRPAATRMAPAATSAVGASSAARSWSAALAAGDLESILQSAEGRGLRRAIAEADSDDLAALADAARYLRRDDVARPALLAQRARFPRSARALDSAFLLGRVEENDRDGEARALRWYDLYLKEAPSGAYASEALGRKMTATERSGGHSTARDIADQYLRRFPNGTYAGAARALRDGP